MRMARERLCAMLLLLLASTLLMQAFVHDSSWIWSYHTENLELNLFVAISPLGSSKAPKAETQENSKISDEPVLQTFVEDKNIGATLGVEAFVFFSKNLSKVVKAGEPTQVVINVTNDVGALKVAYIHASLHLPHDHRVIIQNFTVQYNNSIPTDSKASFSYIFDVVNFLHSGIYNLVGKFIYELDGNSYTHVFYNGTIDVVEGGGFVSGETVFLFTLDLGLLGLLGMWAYSQFQKFMKKQRRSNKKVETGTRTNSDAHANEWL